MALSGTAMEGIIGEIARYKNGGSFIDGFVLGAMDGFINGFTSGALMYCALQAITALAKVASARCATPSNCFIAGTIVLTKDGNKKIEDIEEGDEVWAYDEETGNKALKRVVRLFKNKTKKWIHLLFKLENSKTEEIVCTEEHPFYVNNIGWIPAINLVANDKILLYNNDIAVLHSKEIEELETEETTYNFEVEDYHTYYVGENQLLVHNKCKPINPKKVGESQLKKGVAHDFKKSILKDPKLGNVDKNISHYDIFKDAADNGRLWLKNKTNDKMWIDTAEYLDDLIGG